MQAELQSLNIVKIFLQALPLIQKQHFSYYSNINQENGRQELLSIFSYTNWYILYCKQCHAFVTNLK